MNQVFVYLSFIHLEFCYLPLKLFMLMDSEKNMAKKTKDHGKLNKTTKIIICLV